MTQEAFQFVIPSPEMLNDFPFNLTLLESVGRNPTSKEYIKSMESCLLKGNS